MSFVSRVPATMALLAVVLLPSCAILERAPDPAKVRKMIAEARIQEVELVRQTIADPERVERFLELLGERDRMVEAYTKRISEHRRELTALNADYDARREEFAQLLERFNRQRASAQQETIELVAAMKAATTADEWAVIAEFQLKRLHPQQLGYGQAEGGG